MWCSARVCLLEVSLKPCNEACLDSIGPRVSAKAGVCVWHEASLVVVVTVRLLIAPLAQAKTSSVCFCRLFEVCRWPGLDLGFPSGLHADLLPCLLGSSERTPHSGKLEPGDVAQIDAASAFNSAARRQTPLRGRAYCSSTEQAGRQRTRLYD